MTGKVRFLGWPNPGGLPVRFFGKTVLLVCWCLVLGGIAAVLLNPQNPAFDPPARGELDTQAQTIRQAGVIQGERWHRLVRSASTECHFKTKSPQEFIISGGLPDAYINPAEGGAVRWYIRFPANLSPTLFGPPVVAVAIVSLKEFYGLVRLQGFEACSAGEAARARTLLGL